MGYIPCVGEEADNIDGLFTISSSATTLYVYFPAFCFSARFNVPVF